MKKILLVLVVLGIACGGYYYYRQTKDAAAHHEAQLQAAQQARAEAEQAREAEANAQRLAAEKTAAEAKAKAEAQRIADEKAAAEAARPEVKLEKAKAALAGTDAVWNPVKNQIKQLFAAKGTSLDQQKIDEAIRTQAATLKQQIADDSRQIVELNRALKNAVTEAKRINTRIDSGFSGSNSERYSGWYYLDAPGTVYPMSQYAHRGDRTKRIGYVSKQKENKKAAVNAAVAKAEQFDRQLQQVEQQKEAAEKQMVDLRNRYFEMINGKIAQIRLSASDVLAQRKQLHAEIKTLEAQIGVTVASNTNKPAIDAVTDGE